MSQERRFEELVFSVLGYREHEGCAGLALAMDLRAYGVSFEAALDELAELVETQISFAVWKDQLEMIWRPAERVSFEPPFHEIQRDPVCRCKARRQTG